MAWRPHSRAFINPRSPRAIGVCDRCGFIYSLHDLPFQYDYRGNDLVNIRIRVCRTCYDKPYEGNRPIKLPADPPALMNTRPIQYAIEEGETNPQLGELWDEPGLLWDDGRSDWS